MFSIIIPLYNKGPLIKRTIDSVLSQNLKDFEVIIVDDGSIDDSAKYVLGYKEPRIKYYYKDNGGVSSARNYGIKIAQGDWVVFLDADDELCANSLHFIEYVIEKYIDVRIVVGQHTYEQERPTTIHKTRFPYFSQWMNDFYPRPGAVAINRDILESGVKFDERQSFYEDLEFGLNLLGRGQVAYINKQFVNYYQDGTGLSGSSHPIEKEMAYYIPEYVETASFWHKALLYENIEMEILWWQQHGNEEHVKFYQDMRKKYFSGVYSLLHWLRQKMIRRGII